MSGRHEEIIDEDTVENLTAPLKNRAASVRKEPLKEHEDDFVTGEEDFEVDPVVTETPPVKPSRQKPSSVKPPQDDFSREDEAVAPKRKRKSAKNGLILMIVIAIGLFLAGSLVVGKYMISSSDQIAQPVQSVAAPPPQLPSMPIPKPVVVAAQTPETSTITNKALDGDKKIDNAVKPSDLVAPVIPESSNKVDLVENTPSNPSTDIKATQITDNNRSLTDTLRAANNLDLPLNSAESIVDSCAVILSE